MKITKRTRLNLRLNNSVFVLFMATITILLAWLSTKYSVEADWTQQARHSLSKPSQKIIEQLQDPVQITAYVSNDNLTREPVSKLIGRYQRYKSDIQLDFIDPYTVPDKARELRMRVSPTGELNAVLVIEYQQRSENVQKAPSNLTEEDISAALQRLARNETQIVAFLTGHGERSPRDFANFDLSQFAAELRNRGIEIQTLNFGQTHRIDEEIKTVVIANPQTRLLDPEVAILQNYVEKGGNLLWFLDPQESWQGLAPLAEKLQLTKTKGIIIDPNSIIGRTQPGLVVLSSAMNYANQHPVTQQFQDITLFPKVSGLVVEESDSWQSTPLLTTDPQAWSETGQLRGQIQFDIGEDVDGPLDIGYSLTRSVVEENGEATEQETEAAEAEKEQRIIVTGDGDFLSNQFLNNGGNLDLGLKMVNWLVQEDDFIDIPARKPGDARLDLSANTAIWLAGLFLVILPVGLITTGILIWLQRRKI